ncbi:MAG: MarR family transcriptional regulator [Spirochaetales bacterium]|nr:MarR family transcriptional regulator [Spirochaetales bacterium]
MDYEIQLVELFNQISRKIRKTLAPVFREHELSHTEVFTMFVMNERKTCRVTELATVIGVPASTLTGILDRLVAQGYLERDPDPEDRRSLLLTATPKLKSFIRGLMAPMEDRLKDVFKAMPQSRLERLVGDLQFILERLEHTDQKITEKKMA